MTYQTKSPYNGEVGKAFDEISDKQLEARINAAEECFRNQWRHTRFDERKAALKRAASIARGRSQDFAALITVEMAS